MHREINTIICVEFCNEIVNIFDLCAGFSRQAKTQSGKNTSKISQFPSALSDDKVSHHTMIFSYNFSGKYLLNTATKILFPFCPDYFSQFYANQINNHELPHPHFFLICQQLFIRSSELFEEKAQRV